MGSWDVGAQVRQQQPVLEEGWAQGSPGTLGKLLPQSIGVLSVKRR